MTGEKRGPSDPFGGKTMRPVVNRRRNSKPIPGPVRAENDELERFDEWKEVDDPQKQAFLKALSAVPVITKACRAAQVSRVSVYRWLGKAGGGKYEDEDFKAAFDVAMSIGTESLIEKAYDRAERESDRLMEFLIKGFDPERFRDRKEINHTGLETRKRIILASSASTRDSGGADIEDAAFKALAAHEGFDDEVDGADVDGADVSDTTNGKG